MASLDMEGSFTAVFKVEDKEVELCFNGFLGDAASDAIEAEDISDAIFLRIMHEDRIVLSNTKKTRKRVFRWQGVRGT